MSKIYIIEELQVLSGSSFCDISLHLELNSIKTTCQWNFLVYAKKISKSNPNFSEENLLFVPSKKDIP